MSTKINTLLLLIFLFASCTNRTPETDTAEFDWLIGEWKRTNEQANKTTVEYWQKITGEEYKATSFTLQNQDTVWQEYVVLKKDGQKWFYTVTAKNEPQATPFVLLTHDATSFTCENTANEFPKLIAYRQLTDTTFHAEISGSDLKIDFEFRKVQ